MSCYRYPGGPGTLLLLKKEVTRMLYQSDIVDDNNGRTAAMGALQRHAARTLAPFAMALLVCNATSQTLQSSNYLGYDCLAHLQILIETSTGGSCSSSGGGGIDVDTISATLLDALTSLVLRPSKTFWYRRGLCRLVFNHKARL